MASFARAHREWADLEAAAKQTGSRAARTAADQARAALKQHPSAKDARGFHNSRCANDKAGKR